MFSSKRMRSVKFEDKLMKVSAVPYICYNINEYLKYFHIGRQFQICHSKKFMLEVTEKFFEV